MSGLAHLLSVQAHANRLANARLQRAIATLAALDGAAFHASRTGFFPSLATTLNHILAVDGYYIGALHGEAGLVQGWQRFEPAATPAAWAERQAASDLRLVAYCSALDDAACAAEVRLPRADREERDVVANVLQHLFMHQTHHRGQVHTMLAGTALAPPQLDEFLLVSDGPLRRTEMAAQGWTEAAVYGPAAAPPSSG